MGGVGGTPQTLLCQYVEAVNILHTRLEPFSVGGCFLSDSSATVPSRLRLQVTWCALLAHGQLLSTSTTAARQFRLAMNGMI